jgi:uncharacterized protein (TIGR00106 family)
MTLMDFSIFPLDKGESLSNYVAKVLTVVDESGMDYRLTPMGTVVEGEWDDLIALLTQCFRTLEKESNRMSIQARFDWRRGVRGALGKKVRSVEDKVGRPLKR